MKIGFLIVACILLFEQYSVVSGGAVLYDIDECFNKCGDCQKEYKPVCGANGLTYHNACHLGCEKQCRTLGLKIVHDGECGNPQVYTH